MNLLEGEKIVNLIVVPLEINISLPGSEMEVGKHVTILLFLPI